MQSPGGAVGSHPVKVDPFGEQGEPGKEAMMMDPSGKESFKLKFEIAVSANARFGRKKENRLSPTIKLEKPDRKFRLWKPLLPGYISYYRMAGFFVN
jgi:hypothetical protein